MSDYLSLGYRARVGTHTKVDKSATVSQGIRSFERYLAKARTKEKIIFNQNAITVSIQTSKHNEFGDKHDRLLLASLESGMEASSIFQWGKEYWMILTTETMAIPTHIKGKIRLCNHTLKWQYGSEVFETLSHVALSGTGLDEFIRNQLVVNTANFTGVIVVPLNDKTKTIKKRNQRFVIDNQAWLVTGIDDISIPNLRTIKIKEDLVDMAKDDLQEQVADVHVADPETGEIEVNGIVYGIYGDSVITWGQSAFYEAVADGEAAIEINFEISNESLATLITDAEDNPASILANRDGKIGTVDLIATFPNAVQVIKSIKVVSLWK